MVESETALSRLANASRRYSTGRIDTEALPFPMYTVSWEVLQHMRQVEAHEELLSTGTLTVFEESMGKAVFISHQWLANNHPDPNAEQLKVLQEALRNIISGASQVRLPLALELLYGRVRTPKSADFNASPLYIWYDYFSCPQASNAIAEKDRQRAIDTIVSYVARCEYFVILCPQLVHADQGRLMSQESWAERGWCRTERLARELAAREDGFVIVIESPVHQSLIANNRRHLDAPGMGQFTQESDRPRIGRVLLQLLWRKLQYFLHQQDLPEYRFLLNTQEACCLANLGISPVEGLVPGFAPVADPFTDPLSSILERFLHENGFSRATERDSAGWTPLCYAAVNGSPSLVTALLEARADCNDRITKHKQAILLPKKMPVLSLAAHFRSNEVLQVLLTARADVESLDGHFSVPLHWAASSDNAEGVRLLCAARADPEFPNFPGLNLIRIACFCGSPKVVEQLLSEQPANLQYCLHTALMAEGNSPDLISALLNAKADVNEQFTLKASPLFRLVWMVQRFRHRFSPSSLTALAYHQQGATPLMFSVLNGYFAAAFLLLRAGADPQVRNSRGKAAADFAREVQAPPALLAVLEGRAGLAPDLPEEPPPEAENEPILEEKV